MGVRFEYKSFTWDEMVRAGYLPFVPIDPHGFPYELNPYWGIVTLSEESSLKPLPTDGNDGANNGVQPPR